MKRTIKFNCYVHEDTKRFRKLLENTLSVESTSEKNEGDIIVVSVVVTGPTLRSLDMNFQYVLGVGHGIRKTYEH